MLDPEKSKNIIFSLWVPRTSRTAWLDLFGTGAPEVPLLAKMTKMPLVNPRFDKKSNKVKTLTKQYFSYFYTKPALLGDF